MIGLIIALVVALGVGGTVSVADNARPGDALFGVDHAVEKLRVNIARKENKDELRIRFAEERVEELQDLTSDDNEDDANISDDSENISDDSSDDKKELTDEQKERVSVGISVALNLLTQLDGSDSINSARLETLIAQLNSYLIALPEDAKIIINDEQLKIKFENESEDESSDNQKIKIEELTDQGRIRIEIKNGSIEIKTKLDNDDGDGDDKDAGLGEIEAKVYSDKTIVEIEWNDEETTFVTSAITKDGITTAILIKFPELKQSDVESVLKIETEDEDENDDQKSEEDESDDDDEDNSGSGSSGDN